MEEVRFEDSIVELTAFRKEAEQCKKNTAALTLAVRSVMHHLKASSESLNTVVRMSAQHTPSRAPMPMVLPTIKDSDFVDLIDTVDRLVAKQLDAIIGVASTVETQAKKRRASREKFLKSTNPSAIRRPVSPSKIARRKDDFAISDQRYMELFDDYRGCTLPHAVRVREDFHTGYYTVLSALAQTLQPGTSEQEPVEAAATGGGPPRPRAAATTGMTSFETSPPLRRNVLPNANGGPSGGAGGLDAHRNDDVMSNAYDEFIFGTFASGYDATDRAVPVAALPSGQRRVSEGIVAPGIPMVTTDVENVKTASTVPAWTPAAESPKPPPRNRTAVTAGVMRQSQELRRMESGAAAVATNEAARSGSNNSSTNRPSKTGGPLPSSATTEDHFRRIDETDSPRSNLSERNPFSFMWGEG